MKKHTSLWLEETLLRYILSTKLDVNHQMLFREHQYCQVPEMTAEEVAFALPLLSDKGLIQINFLTGFNNETVKRVCEITVLEPGYTYFERQQIGKKEQRSARRHDYRIAIVSGACGVVIGYVINALIDVFSH